MISHLVQVRGNNGTCNIRYNDANVLVMNSNVGVQGTLLANTIVLDNGIMSTPTGAYAYFSMGNNGPRTGEENASVSTSVFSQHAIQAPQFIALSDARVKTNISHANIDSIAAALRDLPVQTWQYKDTVQRGSRTRLGFVAQQMPEVLRPYVVSHHPDFIPNIFRHARHDKGSRTYRCENHGLSKGDIIRICTKELSVCTLIIDAPDNDTFTIENDVGEEDIFVYGMYAKDVMSIDYDALVAALVASHQDLEKRVVALENTLGSLNTRLEAQ